MDASTHRRHLTLRRLPTWLLAFGGLLLLVVVCGASAYLGLSIGYFYGRVNAVAEQAPYDAMSTALTLRHLRRGDIEGTVDSLEAELNTQIVRAATFDFDLHQWLSWVGDAVANDTPAAMDRRRSTVMGSVKQYRSEFPGRTEPPAVQSMINQELARHEVPKCGEPDGGAPREGGGQANGP